METPVEASRLATVVVPSRNRPDKLARCLERLLATLPAGCDIVCVDQSDAGRLPRTLPSSPSLRYLRSARCGASAGRNDGAEQARGELLLFTDDDCIVPEGWVQSWVDLFGRLPAADIGFGPVRALQPDRAGGFTPEFVPTGTAVHGLGIFCGEPSRAGISANMAIRRRVWRRVGGFDEELGAGSRYPGAEETDISYRLVRSGSQLIHFSGPVVIHDGFRPWGEASQLAMNYSAGVGAMYMKHVRLRDRQAVRLALINSWRMLRAPAVALVKGQRPLGLRALLGYGRGATSSLRLRVERSQRRYRGPGCERVTSTASEPTAAGRGGDLAAATEAGLRAR